MLRKLKLIPAWISEYFKFCPLQRKVKTDDNLFLVIGHRGSPVREIENTIESFERAMNEGANALEIDLCLTRNGEIILWHDWDPNDTKSILRESGFEPFVKYKPHPPALTSKYRKRISHLDYNEFKDNFDYKERHADAPGPANAYIPTLTDFFNWGTRRNDLYNVFMDIKCPKDECDLALPIAGKIKEHMEQYNPNFKVVMETDSPTIHDLLKKNYPFFDVCLDIEPPAGIILDPSEYSGAKTAIENNNKFAIDLRPRKVTIANWTTFRRIIRHDIKLKRTNNLEYLVAATVSKQRELKCLVKMGINGIQTDFPNRLSKLAAKYGKMTVLPEGVNSNFSRIA